MLKVLASYGGILKLHLFCYDFQGTSCLSRFQVSLEFVLAFLLHDNAVGKGLKLPSHGGKGIR